MADRKGFLRPGDRLVCLGDSITADAQGYVAIAQAVWTERQLDIEVINAGRGGDTARQLHERFRNDVLKQQPTWVSIMAGMADTIKYLWGEADSGDTAAFCEEMTVMINLAVQAGIQVALCTPNQLEPCGYGKDLHEAGNIILNEKRSWLNEQAQTGGYLLIPTGEVLLQAQAEAAGNLVLTTDGVHLNDLGRNLTGLTFMTAFHYPLDFNVVSARP